MKSTSNNIRKTAGIRKQYKDKVKAPEQLIQQTFPMKNHKRSRYPKSFPGKKPSKIEKFLNEDEELNEAEEDDESIDEKNEDLEKVS